MKPGRAVFISKHVCGLDGLETYTRSGVCFYPASTLCMVAELAFQKQTAEPCAMSSFLRATVSPSRVSLPLFLRSLAMTREKKERAATGGCPHTQARQPVLRLSSFANTQLGCRGPPAGSNKIGLFSTSLHPPQSPYLLILTQFFIYYTALSVFLLVSTPLPRKIRDIADGSFFLEIDKRPRIM